MFQVPALINQDTCTISQLPLQEYSHDCHCGNIPSTATLPSLHTDIDITTSSVYNNTVITNDTIVLKHRKLLHVFCKYEPCSYNTNTST